MENEFGWIEINRNLLHFESPSREEGTCLLRVYSTRTGHSIPDSAYGSTHTDCFHHRFPARRKFLAGIANSLGAERTRHRKAGRWPAKTKLRYRAARMRGARGRRWTAGAWKFSPPVAKQFPWKRSYGHGFRRINTARVGNNVRARESSRPTIRSTRNVFPEQEWRENGFRRPAAKGTSDPGRS